MDVSVFSVSVKSTDPVARPLPVFGDHDSVNGTVQLASHVKPTSGRMHVSVRNSLKKLIIAARDGLTFFRAHVHLLYAQQFEGLFTYTSPSAKLVRGSVSSPSTNAYQQVFYSDSAILSPMIDSAGPLSSIDAFTRSKGSDSFGSSFSVRTGLRRKPSFSSPSSPESRTFAFSLPLPQKAVTGEDLPPTLSSSVLMESGIRNRAAVERVDISYRLVITWEPHEDVSGRAVYVGNILIFFFPTFALSLRELYFFFR
jgi:hypothetical protein